MDMKIYAVSGLQMQVETNLMRIFDDVAGFLTASIAIQKRL